VAALQNYIDLRFAVSDHVGNRAISDVFPRLVEMAEADFNSRLRTRRQIAEATLTFEGGLSPLPPDFLEIVGVYGLHGSDLHASPTGAFLRPGSGYSSYQIDGYNISINGYSGDRTIQYYAKLPTLTNSPTACNWLLRDYPSIYLYGVGLQAAKHLRDQELAVATSSLYGEAIQLLRVDDERARWSNSIVRVQGLTP